VYSQPAKFSSRGRLLLALVFVLSALYMAKELKRGWVPSDEGTLAESAERVLHGELPHRDYHEGYTGGLSYLNAAAFRVFGTNLVSMRYMLFLFFLAWVPAVYYAASRFVSAPVASAVTLLAVAWGPPNYAAAMPSWYNLFFATFGLAALLRYIEVQTGRWLLVAGLCGGVSFLFKLPGLYFVAGALLFLLFREQMAPSATSANRRESLWYRGFLLTTVLLYEALLFGLLRKLPNAATYLYFWVPNLAVGAAIVWHEFHAGQNRSQRFSFVSRELALFGVGVAAPIAVFLTPYCLTGSLSPVARDLITIPGRLILHAGAEPTVFWFVLGSFANLAVIGAVLLIRSVNPRQFWERMLFGVPIAILIPATLLLARQASGFYMVVWNTIWVLAPLAVVLGMGLLMRGPFLSRISPVQRQRLFLVLAATATSSLIQFPFTIPIYFCYIAPLLLLSVTAIVSLIDRPPVLAVAGAMCFCFLYAVFELTPGFIYDLGIKCMPDIQTVQLSVPRGGGLRVSAATAREYEELDSLIRQHARGEYILAKPDSPEVYFLSGFYDPTGIFFEFYEDSSVRTQRALAAIQLHNINLVVVNHHPPFGGSIADDLRAKLEREFPNRADAGDFEVRWKP
jgi:Dolichyl-phosphate-mannose-protein mannosyltransferase